MRSGNRYSERGYTLVEMMIVVVIVGILATIAVASVTKYIRQSKSVSETAQLLGSIKAAQEAYRADTLGYLDVSAVGDITTTTYYPVAATSANLGTKAYAWGDTSSAVGANFRKLGVHSDAPVRHVYACAAGGVRDVPVGHKLLTLTVANWPIAALGQPWYVVSAKGDLDDDNEFSSFASASFTNQIFIENEGE